MTRIVGLTGGIATGKSTVAKMFEQLGVVLIDADAIVRELQSPGSPVLAEIEAAFGPEVIGADGELDREALGARVFRDPEARKRLGQIVHPRVTAEMLRRTEAARAAGAAIVMLDIPLLLEGRTAGTGSAVPFDAVVLVYASEAAQIERQLERNAYGRDEAVRRVAAQMPIDEKRALADFVVDNTGSLEETERQVREIYAKLVANGSGAP
ncbi:MAG: dephospho-CoA kinase [Deltaproteobacteria bacterium]|nr:MAG: dephospho-CoA kinase [Deltaproteobacteria bacterium]